MLFPPMAYTFPSNVTAASPTRATCSGASGVQIVIGGDDRWHDMQDVSLILARYGVVDEAMGIVGVLGPLRMPYGRAISTVRYVASVMDGLVEWIYK